MSDDFSAARGILSGNYEQLLARSNVVATGVGYKVSGGERTDQLSIVCSVDDKTPASSLSVSRAGFRSSPYCAWSCSEAPSA